MSQPRRNALQVVTAVLEAGAYSNLALGQALKGMTKVDAAFTKQLVYGTLTHRLSIDYLLEQWLSTPLSKLRPAIRNLLRMGLYQVIYLEVPDYAAVNESVRMAHRVGHRGVAALVNAVLRRAVREKADLPWPQTPSLAYNMSIRYSFPEWMIARWLQRFGEAETEMFCAAQNRQPGIDLRINSLRTCSSRMMQELADLGVGAEMNSLVANSLRVRGLSLPNIPPFEDGLITVQGAASTLVSQVLAPGAGQLVYDVCAAPGGKALHLAELMGDRGRLVAVDINERRLRLITAAARRMQIKSVETRCQDAAALHTLGWEQGDGVLVDAPCSGLGVIRRRPDIRWHRSPAAIADLAAEQLKILSSAAALVKPGGVLVYSVCSTEPEETTQVIGAFLQHNPHFQPGLWPQGLRSVWQPAPKTGALFTYPQRHDLDGFYIARLVHRPGTTVEGE